MRPVEKYWIIYYIVFVGSFAFLLWRHWGALRWDNETYVYLLAAIFGLSAGVALMSAIVVEVTGYMVLLIPARIKQLKAEGHKTGREEERREWLAWYERQQAAFRAGIPFTEPPPSGPQGRNGE